MNSPFFKNRSRRKFLRDLSIGTAGVAAGFGFADWAKSQSASGKRKLGVALLGLGRYSYGELRPALKQTQLCQLTGVVTGHPEKAASWAAEFNLPKKNLYNYDNFDSIAHNPDIDIVYVVTRPRFIRNLSFAPRKRVSMSSRKNPWRRRWLIARR